MFFHSFFIYYKLRSTEEDLFIGLLLLLLFLYIHASVCDPVSTLIQRHGGCGAGWMTSPQTHKRADLRLQEDIDLPHMGGDASRLLSPHWEQLNMIHQRAVEGDPKEKEDNPGH